MKSSDWIWIGIAIGLVFGGVVGFFVGDLFANIEMVSCLNSCSDKWFVHTFDNCVRSCMRG